MEPLVPGELEVSPMLSPPELAESEEPSSFISQTVRRRGEPSRELRRDDKRCSPFAMKAAAAVTLLAASAVGVAWHRSRANAGLPLQQRVDGMQSKLSLEGGSVCSYDLQSACPALDLFESPKVQAIAADSLMVAGEGLLRPLDEYSVSHSVAAIFNNVSATLRAHLPAVARKLQRVQLKELRREAVMDSLRLVSDERVRSIGVDVARAIRASSTTDREELRNLIEDQLKPRLEEIQQLRNEVISSQLRELWDEEKQWAMTLDSDSVRAMQATEMKKLVSDRPSAQFLTPQDKSLGILGGVLAYVRVVVDIVDVCARSQGIDLDVPAWFRSVDGRVTPELLSCEAGTAAGEHADAMETLFCPLKFGAMGLDALRAAGIPAGGSIPWMR
jgi:hypothetical protein